MWHEVPEVAPTPAAILDARRVPAGIPGSHRRATGPAWTPGPRGHRRNRGIDVDPGRETLEAAEWLAGFTGASCYRGCGNWSHGWRPPDRVRTGGALSSASSSRSSGACTIDGLFGFDRTLAAKSAGLERRPYSRDVAAYAP